MDEANKLWNKMAEHVLKQFDLAERDSILYGTGFLIFDNHGIRRVDAEEALKAAEVIRDLKL